MTTETAKQIQSLKKSLVLMSRIAGNIQTEDYEDLDAMHRAISDASTELFELELSLTEATDQDSELLAA